jgi:hypothetical protein
MGWGWVRVGPPAGSLGLAGWLSLFPFFLKTVFIYLFFLFVYKTI